MKSDLSECVSDFNSALTNFADSVNILGTYGAELIRRLLDTIVENFSFEPAPPSNNYRKLHGIPMTRRRNKRK